MQMTIDCPGCRKPLRVPEAAGGRRARCPRCGVKFTVPSSRDLLEETVSHWIFEDVQRIREDEDQPPDGAGVGEGTMIGVAERSAVIAETPAPGYSGEGEDAVTGSAADRPHLFVRDCTKRGVKLAFNARWLELEAFGASMPVACVFSGLRERENLCARPMVFLKYFEGMTDSIRTIESTYERQLHKFESTRDVLASIGRLRDMRPPFDHPLVYFASLRKSDEHLECTCRENRDGAIICELVVPDGSVALEWLGRVNGICGQEYEALAADVSQQSSEQWQTLSESARSRLNTWAKLHAGEIMRVYLRDADLSEAETGSAGLVVTDRRIIFHKYHRLQSIPLDQPGDLLVKLDENVARLALRVEGHVMRIGKIAGTETSLLKSSLADSKLKMRLV